MAPLLDLITTAESFMQQNLATRTLVTQLLTSSKYWAPARGLTVGLSSCGGLDHGGFVNATAWNPSSPASRAQNASEAVSHRNTTQASPIVSASERCSQSRLVFVSSTAWNDAERCGTRARARGCCSRDGPDICRHRITTHNGFVDAEPWL
jgi:hypothetical protein